MVQAFDLVLINGKIFTQNKFIQANLGILNGVISEISKNSLDGYETLDCKNKWIFPGLIDLHVHFRTPGQEYKEDWRTGSLSALAGGITSVMDMPNTIPSTVTAKLLEKKRKLIQKKSLTNYGFHFGLTSNNSKEFAEVKNCVSGKIYFGSSTGDLLVADQKNQRDVFLNAKKLNKTVFVHAESESGINKNLAQYDNSISDPSVHSKIRSVKAEVLAVESALYLQAQTQAKVHFCHISSKSALDLIQKAKQTNSFITCEVTSHHLFLSDQSYKTLNNFAKVNPSLKSKQDILGLWQGIQLGIVDTLGTDHAPHTIEEKSQDYSSAPSGMPGLETAFPLLLTELHKGTVGLDKIIQLYSENPARLMNLKNKGFIAQGKDADLIVVDPNFDWTVKNDGLFTKCKWSAFDGWKLKGKVEQTIVNGNLMFADNQLVGKSLGQELSLKC